MKLIKNNLYLLLIDEEAEVCRGQYRFLNNKIELIHEGHNYPYKGEKIIAYRKLNSEAKELDLPLLPPFEEVDEFEQFKRFSEIYTDTVIELAIEIIEDNPYKSGELYERELFKRIKEKGYKVALSKFQYSLEDMKKAFEEGSKHKYVCEANGKDKKCYCRNDNECNLRHYMTAEEFIQSISTQQLPKEFVLGEGGTIEEQIKNGYYIW